MDERSRRSSSLDGLMTSTKATFSTIRKVWKRPTPDWTTGNAQGKARLVKYANLSSAGNTQADAFEAALRWRYGVFGWAL